MTTVFADTAYCLALLNVNDELHVLRTYWSIPERQVETSVVLASSKPDCMIGFPNSKP